MKMQSNKIIINKYNQKNGYVIYQANALNF